MISIGDVVDVVVVVADYIVVLINCYMIPLISMTLLHINAMAALLCCKIMIFDDPLF